MDDPTVETYFTTHQKPFPKPINGKINTEEFLIASRGLLYILEKLGKVFAPARYDLLGNIEKLTKKYDENHNKYVYLEDIVFGEKEVGQFVATDALMWLRRGLHFLLEFFESVVNDNTCKEDLRDFMKSAYDNTLKRYHGWFGINLFNLLIKFVPPRKQLLLYFTLDQEENEQVALEQLEAFLVNYRCCIEHLMEFYSENNLESNTKV